MKCKSNPAVTHHTILHLSDMLYTVKIKSPRAGPSGPAPILSRAAAHPDAPTELQEHGAPTRRYLQGKVQPALKEGLNLLKQHEPSQPLKALGEFLLGTDTITGRQRVPFSRKVVADLVLEATKILAVSRNKPEEPLKWMGQWFLAHSAEYM